MNGEEIREALVTAINESDNCMKLRARVVELRQRHVGKETLLEVFQELRSDFNEEKEDIILEVMDFLVGYCSSHVVID